MMELSVKEEKQVKKKSFIATTLFGKTAKARSQNIFITLCVAPPFILFFIFKLYPMIEAAIMSLYRSTGLSSTSEFIGLENFKILFNDPIFWTSFKNTIFLLIVFPLVTMVISIFLAVILTQGKLYKWEASLYRIVYFFPNILSMVVIGMIFMYVYDYNLGILNSFFDFIGLEGLKHTWLGETDTVLWAIAMTMVWQAVGYYMVMYIAGINRIPGELYEAAEMDGASKVRQFFTITLPLIWEVVRVTIIFYITGVFNLSFIFIQVMTKGGPNNSSHMLLTYMYDQAFLYANYGYAMAITVIVCALGIVLALLIRKLTEKETIQF